MSNAMLALRVLSNMISEEPGFKLAYQNKLRLLSIIENIKPPLSKPIQVRVCVCVCECKYYYYYYRKKKML